MTIKRSHMDPSVLQRYYTQKDDSLILHVELNCCLLYLDLIILPLWTFSLLSYTRGCLWKTARIDLANPS